jgi:hypothetical protein
MLCRCHCFGKKIKVTWLLKNVAYNRFFFFCTSNSPPRPKHLRITRDYFLLVLFSRVLTAAALRAAIGQAVNSDQEQQREKHFLQKFNPVSYVSEFTVCLFVYLGSCELIAPGW